MAGRCWYSLRTPEQTSYNRVRAFTKGNVQNFYNNLDEVLTEHEFEPRNIWNMDETGLSNVPTKIGKVISLKGLKKVGLMASQERGTMLTMALAVNAAGGSMPPFYLFPRKNMQAVFLENASIGSAGYANESGWMCQSEFVSSN